MFESAIFDLDGLLIDSERSVMKLWLEVSAELGRPLTEPEYFPVIGRTDPDTAAILIEILGKERFEQADRRAQHTIMNADPALLFPVKTGARELLNVLQERAISLGVASSTQLAEVQRRLAAVGLLEFFEVVVGGDQVSKGKPDPALYRLAAGMLDTNPSRCLAFEDSDNGVASAASAHVGVVVVPDLKAPSDVSRAASLEVITSLTIAISWIDEWFPSSGGNR